MCGWIRYGEVEGMASVERCPHNRGVSGKLVYTMGCRGTGLCWAKCSCSSREVVFSKGILCVVEYTMRGIGAVLWTEVILHPYRGGPVPYTKEVACYSHTPYTVDGFNKKVDA